MRSPYLYDLDDRPPWHLLLLYGVQWAFILFPALAIVASIGVDALGLDSGGAIRFFQWTLLTSGLFTLLQTLWGHRYPLLDGPSTALVLTLILLAPGGLPSIQGGTILGGILLLVLVLSGRLDRLIRLFTPNVTAVILMLIALGLLHPLLRFMSGAGPSRVHGEPYLLLLSLFLALIMATLSFHLKGLWRSLSILVGMVLGSLLFLALGRMEWGRLLNASWASFSPGLFPSTPRFTWAACVAFACAYLAVVVNSLGSIQGIAEITDTGRIQTSIRRGMLFNGLGGVLCGLVGVVGTVSYSMSPGVVLTNRVASRFALTCCGGLVLLAAFSPKLAALFSILPAPVVGAALCVALGGQMGVGISILASRELTSRDYFVVGMPLIMGTLAGFLPHELISAMPAMLQMLIANSLVVGVCLVLLLEHLLLRKTKS